ncbi:MAG: SusC/RagA family TonB-linked outer membrane protein [Prolixibacteraceae bacterium]|nr:SusC/RagA family TonB-linked outer membrane protein [Prolixibacteraceae bacterium]
MNHIRKNRLAKRVFLFAAFVLTGLLSSSAQDSIQVKGIIVSPENKPVSNVSVSVEGSRDMPAFTNESGEFSVMAQNGDQWLNVAPAADYKRKRIFIDNRVQLTIVVTPIDITSGEDEVMLLSQPVPIKNVASSFSDLNLDNVQHSIVPSIDRYMQGHIAGMHVINQSGDPASGSVTFIRGINSLNATTQPLYVVDGAIMESTGIFGSVINGYNYNPLIAINPLDISNATIMKDVVYSAAYGSKASNGLIMIETLDPSATETSFEIDIRRGLSLKPERYIPQLNAIQHKTLAKEMIYSSGIIEEDIEEIFPNLFLQPDDDRYIDYQHDTDWQQLVFDNAAFTNLNIKVKGGDEIARYGLSFGYYNNNGIIRNTRYDGYNLRFVSLVNIFTWLRMNASVSFNTSESDLKESAVIKGTSPILTSLAKSPLLNPYQYDADDLETTMLSEVDEFGVSNPLATIENFEASSRNYHINTTLGFEIDFSKKLFFRTNVGIIYNSLKEKLFMPNKGMELYYDQEAHNVAKASTNTFDGFSNNSMLVYDTKIGNDHVINSTTGVNVMTNQFQYDWGVAKNAHQNDEYRMLQDGINDLREIGGQNRNWNWLSLYEKVSYTYQDKYLFTGTVSLDGSSRIGSEAAETLNMFGQPFGLFYSAGLGWRISNERFMNSAHWIDELKLRVSAGRTGNDDVGESSATNYYRTLQYRESTGLVPVTMPNYKLTYEFVDQLNAGVDIALWGNRFRVNIDVFQTNVSNMLVYMPLEAYLGYDYRPENAGKMSNTGWDAFMFLRIVNGKNFKWDIEANVSQATNKIVEISNDEYITDINGHYEVAQIVGEAASSFYGFRFLGVYSTSDEAVEAGLVNEKGIAYRGGDAIYEDISGPNGEPDKIINDYDKVVIGSPFPEMIGGLTNTFRYRNWTLSAFVNFVTGNEVFNYLRYKNESMTGFANQSTNMLNRWQYDGQVTDVPRALWGDPVGNSAFSSRWIEDGSYLRLKNVSLSYKIPKEFLLFKNAEFYISASNLLTFSKYLGYDPEFAYSYRLNEQGVDYGMAPHARQFLVGIKLGL